LATAPQPLPKQSVITTSPGCDNSSHLAAAPISSQGLKYLFCFICLVIPLLYWPPAFDAAGVPREMLLAVIAGLALTLFCSTCFRSVSIDWHPIFVLMLILLAWAILSYFWSEDIGSSQLAITQFASLIILTLLASRLTRNDVLDYVIPISLIAATITALIGIGQNFGFNPFLFRMSSGSPSSTFINSNYASNYFDLITPAAFAFLLLQPTSKNYMRFLAATAFTVSLSCLIICHSRGSWLGLLAVLVVLSIICLRNPDFRQLFFASLQRHSRSLIIALAFVVVIVSLPSKFPPSEKLDAILSATPDTSIETRLHVYQNALVGIADHAWFGVGYGAFTMGFSPYIDAVHPVEMVSQTLILRYMHSDPLQMFFELGIPGGLISITIYILAVAMCWKILRSNAENRIRLLSLGLLLALIASGIHACVDFPLHLPTSAFFFWLWIGLITGLYLHVFPTKTIKLSRVMLIASSIAGLAFSIYSTQLYASYLRANSDVFTAMRNALQHKCDVVFKHSDKAMNEFGRDHLTRFWYAKVYTYCDAPANIKLQAMNRILALAPNMPLPYLTRGQIRLKNGDLEGAAADFNVYRKLLPHRPEGYIGLGQVANHLNDKVQARYWLEKGQYWLEKTRPSEGRPRSNAQKEDKPSNTGVKNSTQ